MKFRVKFICLGILAVLIGLVYRFGLSQTPTDEKSAKLVQLFGEALPQLEAVLGYSLPLKPEFRPVNFAEGKKVPGWETYSFVSWRFPALQGPEQQKSRQLAHHSVTLATVARNVEGTNAILVIPDNLANIAAWDSELNKVNSPSFLQLALVHAVVRMTLENKYGLLDKKYDPHSLEEFRIGQALQEGGAQWITLQVAKRLGTEVYFPLLARVWLHVPDDALDPQLRTTCQACLHQKNWAYTKGLAFFEYLQASTLDNVEKQVFENPPRHQTWIELPELYLQKGLNNVMDLKTILTELEKRPPHKNWRSMQQPWNPQLLYQVADMLKEGSRAKKISQGWRDGRSLIWSQAGDPGKYVGLSAVLFETEKDARAYFGFAVDLQRKRDELSGKSAALPFRVLETNFQELDWPHLEEGVRNEKTVSIGEKGKTMPISILLGRSGSLVLEVNGYGSFVDQNWAKATFQALLARQKINPQ